MVDVKEHFHDAKEDLTDFCDYAVVEVDKPWHIVLFILNIFLPGIGTFISAFMGDRKLNELALLFGVL